jgi:protein SCO1
MKHKNQQGFRTEVTGIVPTLSRLTTWVWLKRDAQLDTGGSTFTIQNVWGNHNNAETKPRYAKLITVCSLVLVSALFLAACSLPFGDDESSNGAAQAGNGDDPPGVLLEDPEMAPGFTLTGHDGQPVSLAEMEGKIVAIFFGYTGCPDICPMTLGYMAQATEALGDDADQVEYLLVTVDPEQDDPEQLAKYVSRIEAPITGLTGDRAELEPVWDDYDITVERREREGGGYLVDHSAQVWIIDQQGDLVMFMPMGADGDELTAALRWLLDQESAT